MKNSQSPDQDKSLDLVKMIQKSAQLDPDQALVFDLNLQRVRRYNEGTDFQVLHSRALLERMKSSHDLPTLHNLSERQEDMPHFRKSAQLQELFAQGIMLIAQKDATTQVHEDHLKVLFDLPCFDNSRPIQRAAAALLLESVANSQSPRQAKELERRFWTLPNASSDPEIQKMASLAKELTLKTDRQPVVKVDLSHKVPSILRSLSKIVGIGDYRMRVWLGGSPRCKHLVVKVAARSEQAARDAVQNFMDEFLAGENQPAREILDIFPPGSVWESGRHPVLKL